MIIDKNKIILRYKLFSCKKCIVILLVLTLNKKYISCSVGIKKKSLLLLKIEQLPD